MTTPSAEATTTQEIIRLASAHLQKRLHERGMSMVTYALFRGTARYCQAYTRLLTIANGGDLDQTRKAGRAFLAELLDEPPGASYWPETPPPGKRKAGRRVQK